MDDFTEETTFSMPGGVNDLESILNESHQSNESSNANDATNQNTEQSSAESNIVVSEPDSTFDVTVSSSSNLDMNPAPPSDLPLTLPDYLLDFMDDTPQCSTSHDPRTAGVELPQHPVSASRDPAQPAPKVAPPEKDAKLVKCLSSADHSTLRQSSQATIAMRHLQNIMESDDALEKAHLTHACTFIIQCNTCTNLFRNLDSFFLHKEYYCQDAADDYLQEFRVPPKQAKVENEDPETVPNETNGVAEEKENEENEISMVETVACEFCNKIFENSAVKLRHDMYFHAKTELPTEEVSYSDLRDKILARRENSPVSPSVVSAEPNSEADLYECEFCGEEFRDVLTLKGHIHLCKNFNTHDPPRCWRLPNGKHVAHATRLSNGRVACDFCTMDFGRPQNLKRHIRRFHTRYECNCLKKSMSEDAPDRFKDVNYFSENAPAQCVSCYMEFPSPFVLKKHMENVHPQFTQKARTGVKRPLLPTDDVSIFLDIESRQCLVCLERFSTISNVRKHVRLSHPDRLGNSQSSADIPPPLKKSTTENESWLSNELLKPRRSKFSETCTICGKSFSDSAEYNAHILLPHKINIRT